MAIDAYVSEIFPIKCSGRDVHGKEVLTKPVEVKVKVYKNFRSNTISGMVNCPYNVGGHGQRCKASHPDVDKVGEGIGCPYSFDIPSALEKK
jgi:hypothetical protein